MSDLLCYKKVLFKYAPEGLHIIHTLIMQNKCYVLIRLQRCTKLEGKVLNPFKLSFFSNQITFTTIPAGQGQRSKVTSAAVALWILEASNQVTLLTQVTTTHLLK